MEVAKPVSNQISYWGCRQGVGQVLRIRVCCLWRELPGEVTPGHLLPLSACFSPRLYKTTGGPGALGDSSMCTSKMGQGLITVVFWSPYGTPAYLRVQPPAPLQGPYSNKDIQETPTREEFV